MRQLIIFLSLILPICTIGQTEIFSEDFESGIPATWTMLDNDQNTVHPSVSEFQSAWITLTDPDDENNTVAGSTSYFSPEGRASRWLITPSITLGDYGNFLYWRAASHDPSFPDWYMVLISTTGTAVEDFTDTLFRLQNEFPYWTDRSVNISDSGYNSIPVHLAFVNNTNRGFKLYLDDVRIDVNDPVSVKENEQIHLSVFPNPATDFIYIQTSESIDSYQILSPSGQVIQNELPENNQINVQNLSNGMYFIRIKTASGGYATQRFLKK